MPTILLICSDPKKLDRIKSAINISLYDLIVVTAGTDAVKIIEDKKIDLIISDIDIGHFDIWKLTRLIRSNLFKIEKNIPVVLLTQVIPVNLTQITTRDFGINNFFTYNQIEYLSSLIPQLLSDPDKHLDKPSALVVEDHTNNAQLIKRILQSRFDVELANNGESGLKKWEENRHNIVLLDVMLPKLSGSGVLSKIMSIDPEQLVIVITAHGTSKMAREMMLSGATDFISKPFKAEELRLVCELSFKRKDFLAWNKYCENLQN